MTGTFDASFVWDRPLEDGFLAQLTQDLDHWSRMEGALTNARFHGQRELERLVNACNRVAWGGGAFDAREPTAAEAQELLAALNPEDRVKLLRDAALAAAQRHAVSQMETMAQWHVTQRQAEADAMSHAEAQRREFEEFEAYDAAGKDSRFAAWRAANGN